jgi:hypothetical protein
MVWTYGSSLLTNQDRIRFLIGDIEEEDQLLQDEEIAATLTLPLTPAVAVTDPRLLKSAYVCAQSLVAKFSKKVSLAVGGASAQMDARARAYRDLANDLLIRLGGSGAISPTVAPYAGGLSVSERDAAQTDIELVQSAFRRELFNAPGTSEEDA